MLDYSLPYVILFLVYLLLGILEIKFVQFRRRIQICESIIFILFFGARGYIGTDWYNYYYYYSTTTLQCWNSADYEFLFSLIAKVFHNIGFNFSLWILLLTSFQIYLFDRYFSKKIPYMFLAYIVLIAVFPNLFIDTIRNFISLLIGVWALDCWNRRKYVVSLSIIALSVCFHSTGIIFLLLLPLVRNYIPRKYMILFSIIGIYIYLFQVRYLTFVLLMIGSILGGTYEQMINIYCNSELYSGSYGITLGIVEKIMFLLFVLYKYNTIVDKREISPIALNVFCLYIYSNFYLSEMHILIARFAISFYWGYIIIVGSIAGYYYRTFNKRIIYFLILSICFLKTLLSYNYVVYDYSNILFNSDSIEQRKSLLDDFYMQ